VDNKKTKPYLQTDVGFQLHFDRQEEVSRFPDHPGVLVDLAVFDLLAQGGSPAGQSTTQNLPTDQLLTWRRRPSAWPSTPPS
jgi:hypothetical protein